jgi:hypothetical protein
MNPPKAKKEKIFVGPGHHFLWYSFYYFICHNVKSRIGNELYGYCLVRCLYLMRWGWSAAWPRRAFLSASYSE